MNLRIVIIVALVLAVVVLAIFLAMRPSQTAGELAAGADGTGSSRTGAAITSVGSSATSFIASIADAAG